MHYRTIAPWRNPDSGQLAEVGTIHELDAVQGRRLTRARCVVPIAEADSQLPLVEETAVQSGTPAASQDSGQAAPSAVSQAGPASTSSKSKVSKPGAGKGKSTRKR